MVEYWCEEQHNDVSISFTKKICRLISLSSAVFNNRHTLRGRERETFFNTQELKFLNAGKVLVVFLLTRIQKIYKFLKKWMFSSLCCYVYYNNI